MNARILSERDWKVTAQKFKVRDNGLERALAAYEKLDQERLEDRLRANALIAQLASSLRKVKDVAALPEVTKYLGEMLGAAESNRKQIEAEATAAAREAEAAKHSEAREKQESPEKEEEEEGDYAAQLLAAFQKLKNTKDFAYPFLVCDAKPHCGVILAKRLTPQHKEELSRLTGGSKKFLHPGTCHFENGRYVFSMEEPMPGLARKLQDSIKFFTEKKLPILVGGEAADETETPSGSSSELNRAPISGHPALEKAPAVWHEARQSISGAITQLKDAIRKEYAEEAPGLLAGVEKSVGALDVVLQKLDHKLAEALARAHAAKDPDLKAAELKAAKSLLTEHIQYVKSEPLIEHIDSNPFGVATNLKQKLTATFMHMAQAIG